MKDVGLRIRIDRELRESFLEACMAEDKPAAQVLREFMRGYLRHVHEDHQGCSDTYSWDAGEDFQPFAHLLVFVGKRQHHSINLCEHL